MKFYPEGQNPQLLRTFDKLEDVKIAMMNGSVMESRVLMCDSEHNLHVDLGIIRGVIPREEGAIGIDDGTTRDIALISKVNKPVCFIILGFQRDESGNISAILSRKAVQLGCKKNFIDNLAEGDIIDARVTHLEKFGAFIDIGAGINALIPIDMLSVSRISHPGERVYEGENIKAVLRKREPQKLTFSLKELLGTWSENAMLFEPGQTVTGTVRSIETYGVFVELTPNLAGLAEPCDYLFEGQRVAVYIKSVLPDKMKIKLVIVEAFEEADMAQELTYFVNAQHIDRFDYSPPGAPKVISTVFE
ncbi:MAG TPA: S1 RNA-binding domain-containing protein [Candidatus Eubacterium faecipullorum]|uniref:S1 RNA-binding domain-containing protein n=1 Tax=Candidatus Eubacterium faecipullorum TaxID=2838571 RepID=A0A9D1UG11_9FIRM|nr:S1 RNA-binding domain-containing protein [Candidatus Eubacterium faecipullorum]